MREKRGFGLAVAVALVLINFNIAFSQEQAAQTEPVSAAETAPVAPTVATVEAQWVWGEIVSVDAAKGEFAVRYLDYETDQEKEMTLSADDKTIYENAQSLADIKPKDTLSIDYVVNADGNNIAKNISVEKAEALPEPAKAPEATEPPPTNVTEPAPKAQ